MEVESDLPPPSATKRQLPPHWCPGCWVEMPAGASGKCRACVGPADSVWAGGMVHFFHDFMRPEPPLSDYRYHGRMPDGEPQ